MREPASDASPVTWRLDNYLEKYQALRESVAFSKAALAALSEKLGNELPAEKEKARFIAISGSLARLEGSPQSDIDFMIVYHSAPLMEDHDAFRSRVKDILADTSIDWQGGAVNLLAPNPKGVFAGDAVTANLVAKIGASNEPYENLSQRLLLILESCGLWNSHGFSEAQKQLLAVYAKDVTADASKHYVLLLNDLIRYFRSICVNYHAQKEDVLEFGRWPLRNLKLRHSRIVMYISLLVALGELSKPAWKSKEGGKWRGLLDFVALPPLERLVRVYESNADDGVYRLLGLYNVFLSMMSNQEVRAALGDLDYDQRYHSDYFAQLKANSDAFASEIARFIYARRGQWSDRFFEYLVV